MSALQRIDGLRMSALPRIARCPASLYAGRGLSTPDNAYSTEGTMLHERANSGDLEGLTADQAEAVEFIRRYVEEVSAGQVIDEVLMEDELTLELSDYEITGHCDRAHIRMDGVIDLYEYKFGYIPVNEPERNEQVQAYALALYQRYQLPVMVHVIQPRCKHRVKTAYFDEGGMDAVQQHLEQVLLRATAEAPYLSPGPMQCKYCPAKLDCPSIRDNASGMLALHDQALPEDLGKLKEFSDGVEVLSAFVADAKTRMREYLEDGGAIPGRELIVKNGRRTLIDEKPIRKAVRGLVKKADIDAMRTISIKKIEDAAVRAYAARHGCTLKNARLWFIEATAEGIAVSEPVNQMKFTHE